MYYIDVKYLLTISSQLNKFSTKTSRLYNCRCPLCGDSKTNQSKARGYFYPTSDNLHLLYKCHNCNVVMNFPDFLKKINLPVYNDYMIEYFMENKTNKKLKSTSKIKFTNSKIHDIDGLIKVSTLSPDHPCKQYVMSRIIPPSYHRKLYYCKTFMAWTNEKLPGKFDMTKVTEEDRLVIPFFDDNKNMFAYQGRALDNNNPVKYITIKLNENLPKIYGIDTVNFNEQYFCFEGVFDSMFLQNSLACCGSSLHSEVEKLDRVTENAVLVFDNQPRNKELKHEYLSAIKKGYKVVIWPEEFTHKDINDYIIEQTDADYFQISKAKTAIEYVTKVIKDNIYSGLEAELQFSKWRKI